MIIKDEEEKKKEENNRGKKETCIFFSVVRAEIIERLKYLELSLKAVKEWRNWQQTRSLCKTFSKAASQLMILTEKITNEKRKKFKLSSA